MLSFGAVLAGMIVMGAPSIEIGRADVTFPEPQLVRIEVAAVGDGVEVGSYGLRQVEKLAEPLPGFVMHGDYGYLAAAGEDEANRHLFLDNQRGDADPREGSVAMIIDVSQWPDGEQTLLLFACNRPAAGDYVHHSMELRIEVADGRAVQSGTVVLDSLQARIAAFSVSPEIAQAGEVVEIRAATAEPLADWARWQLTVPYWIEEHETPRGFVYDPEAQKAYLTAEHGFADNTEPDADAAEGRVLLRLDTTGWPVGVHNFTLRITPEFAPDHEMAWRDLAITIRPDNPRFEIEREHDQELRQGQYFLSLVRTGEASAQAYGFETTDGGRTWQKLEHGGIGLPSRLSDGTIMGMGFRSEPIEGRAGYYRTSLTVSEDGGRTVQSHEAILHVPQATAGIGHAFAAGPLFHRSIVDLPDGSLLAIFYGWFEGDESPVPGQRGAYRYRTWVMRSEDRGHTWEYHATVGYDPEIGTEGYCEAVMKRLPNGDLLSLLRTGGDNRPYHLDNPLCVSRSEDNAATWSEPERTGWEGVAPDLTVMSDGTLACSTGRPGAWLLLSDDNGRTWREGFSINAQRYSGYTSVIEIEPGVLLYGYGVRDWLDPETGERRDSLRTVRIRVRRLR